jgi:tetratricopeptide (TPR) repeat protein
VLLVGVCLRTRRWRQALVAARRASALAAAAGPGPRAAAAAATALALAHLARETPGMSPSERSKRRAEARALLEPLAGRGGAAASAPSGAPPCAEALYLLALLQAEGGHYRDALEAARDALAACADAARGAGGGELGAPLTSGGPPLGGSALLRPAILGLLALLLSPHQPHSAMTLADAALAACPATGGHGEDTAADGEAYGGAAAAGGLGAGPARGLDITLLRLKAALAQSLSDAGGALEALAAARARLGVARAPEGGADDAAAREYALAEAQVRARGQGAGAVGWIPNSVPAPHVRCRPAPAPIPITDPTPHPTLHSKQKVWRELAAIYSGQAMAADAALCAEQARGLDPFSADTAAALGGVAEAAGGPAAGAAAADAFQTALALEPENAPALRGLGALLARGGGAGGAAVAHSLLADALRYDSGSALGWGLFGAVEQAGPDHAAREAERHLCHAVTLAAAAPILPTSELPLLL